MTKKQDQPEYEWPYLISLAETDQIKEYDKVRPIVKAYKTFQGTDKDKCLAALSTELQAVQGKFNFDKIAKAAWTAVRMSDKDIVEQAAQNKSSFDLEFGAVKAIFDSGITEMHWFDMMLRREELAMLFKIYSSECKRRGVNEQEIVKRATEITEEGNSKAKKKSSVTA